MKDGKCLCGCGRPPKLTKTMFGVSCYLRYKENGYATANTEELKLRDTPQERKKRGMCASPMCNKLAKSGSMWCGGPSCGSHLTLGDVIKALADDMERDPYPVETTACPITQLQQDNELMTDRSKALMDCPKCGTPACTEVYEITYPRRMRKTIVRCNKSILMKRLCGVTIISEEYLD